MTPAVAEAPSIEREVAAPSSLVRSALLIMGASVFAYLFGVVVHEVGHYVVAAMAGVPDNGIVLHPFDLSYNDYGDLSEVSDLRVAIQSAAGPLLNLTAGVIVGLLAWRRRTPMVLPFVMWGAMALLQEGVGMIIGLVDYPNVGTDWVTVMELGVPPVAIGLATAALFVAGSAWMLLLLPLAGIRAEDAFWRKLVVFLAGIPLLLVGAIVYLAVAGSDTDSLAMVEQNRRIALGASLLLVTALAALHRPLAPRLGRISHVATAPIGWQEALFAVALGFVVIVFMVATFN